ncbi:low temperature requirement protein A [Novosphingobium sp.]|uniref:low temperature requirement protein A n=1 Tax=Novosphingobium sp. TaxID=1874826 RepID=UPI0025FC63BE|nr:low temperature requirement protein A [Novosphingobium sp.]
MTEPTPKPAPKGGIGAAVAAANENARRSLLRNHNGGYAEVSNLELFFDLVFVFAITQLSHFLLGRLTPSGALQTAILFAAVWWAWMYTTWATNWINPDRAMNRLMLGSVMLASMIMSAAIPQSFGSAAIPFAASYVAVQIGRSLYVWWTMERDAYGAGLNQLRITAWFVASLPFWMFGALTGTIQTQITAWVAALAIEYAGPFLMFRTPGLGRSSHKDWIISGNHMSERCGLFIIIALGEGLIISGATYAQAPAQAGLNLALINAFVGSFAMWWLYFDIGARRGARHIEHHAMPGLIAREAFTYWHIPIVAGIVVLAVGDELMLAHPLDQSHADFVAVVIGGAALFVGGLAAFKRISSGNPWYPASHAYGLIVLAAIGAWGLLQHPSHLALMGATTLLFGAISVWEWVSFHGGWLERMENRNMWLGKILRARIEKRRSQRLAKEATNAASREA